MAGNRTAAGEWCDAVNKLCSECVRECKQDVRCVVVSCALHVPLPREAERAVRAGRLGKGA